MNKAEWKENRKKEDMWLKEQHLEPKCVSIDYHSIDTYDFYYAYVFDGSDFVLKQYFGMNPHLTIEDKWNDDVLAFTKELYDNDNVRCAESLLETLKGSRYIRKKKIENIIYKLMVGDMYLRKE